MTSSSSCRRRLEEAGGAGEGQFVEHAEGGLALWQIECGQLRFAQGQLHLAFGGDAHGVGDGLGTLPEEARHLLGRFEILLHAARTSLRLQSGEIADGCQHFVKPVAQGLQVVATRGRFASRPKATRLRRAAWLGPVR
jgi:hypothetical protein